MAKGIHKRIVWEYLRNPYLFAWGQILDLSRLLRLMDTSMSKSGLEVEINIVLQCNIDILLHIKDQECSLEIIDYTFTLQYFPTFAAKWIT